MTKLKLYIDTLISKLKKVPTIYLWFVGFLIFLIPTTIFWLRLIAVVENFKEVEEFYTIELPIRALINRSMSSILTTMITVVVLTFFIWEMRKKSIPITKTEVSMSPKLLDTTAETKLSPIIDQEKELQKLEEIQAKRKRLMESMKKIENGEDLDSEDIIFLEGLEEEFKDEPEIKDEPEDIDFDKMDSEIERLKNLTKLEHGIDTMKIPYERKKKPLEILKSLKIFQRKKPKRNKEEFNPRAMPL